MHPYWLNCQKYFITTILKSDESLTAHEKYLWWANEDFFQKFKKWLYEEWRAVPNVTYLYKLDNPDVPHNEIEYIEFQDARQAELFVLKFSK